MSKINDSNNDSNFVTVESNNDSNFVTIDLDLDIKTLIELTLYAHNNNITLNDAINNILKQQLKLFKQIGNI